MIIRSISIFILVLAICLKSSQSTEAENRADPTIPYIQYSQFSFVEQFVIESQKLVDTNRVITSKTISIYLNS